MNKKIKNEYYMICPYCGYEDKKTYIYNMRGSDKRIVECDRCHRKFKAECDTCLSPFFDDENKLQDYCSNYYITEKIEEKNGK